MSARKSWIPPTILQQIALMQDIYTKLPQYQAALGLTNDEVASIRQLCLEFVSLMTEVRQAQESMKAVNEWRDVVIWGAATNKPAVPSPLLATPATPTVDTGLFEQIKAFRDQTLTNPGFTVEMGEDLGFLGQQESPRPPSEITPAFKVAPGQNYTVTLTGNMQGFTAARVEYRTSGGTFAPIGFIQNSGGSVTVPTPTDGKPEAGEVRTVFVKQGQPYGNYSPNYSVVVS